MKSRTFAEGWEASIRRLLRTGQHVPTERSVAALEVADFMLTVTEPGREPRYSTRYAYGQAFLESYIESYGKGFSVPSVGRRIFGFQGEDFDQLDSICKKLRANWFSRRAVVALWKPLSDSPSPNPPCLVGMQFLLRDYLNLTAWFRSNDAWVAALPDMLALSSLHQQVALELKVPCGTYTHIATSYHIYESDLAIARRAFGLA